MDNRKVKIVVTVGPACDSEKTLEKLILNGVNVFRLNFSHGTPSYFSKVITRINKLKKKLKINVSIFLDLPGPKIRTGVLQNGKLEIIEGHEYTLGPKGDIPVLEAVLSGMSISGKIALSDGKIELKPIKRINQGILAEALNSGTLLNKQSLNADGLIYEKKYPTEKDIEGIKFGLGHGITTFALSFVSKKEDIINVRKFTGENSILIAKIEREVALKNFKDIAVASDVIMVARGDLGLNMDIVKVPFVQRNLIRDANKLFKPVITATQVLESMTTNPLPTRAEVDDVFTAILEGTDAIMLSEETAVGAFPVKAVDMLRRMIAFNYTKIRATRHEIKGEGDAIIRDVANLSENTGIKNLIIFTKDGKNAFRLSRYNTNLDIFAVTDKKNITDLLTFGRNITSIHSSNTKEALKLIKSEYNVDKTIIINDVPGARKSKSSIDVVTL